MKYTQLNKNWKAASEQSEPLISVTEDTFELTFELEPGAFAHIDKGDKGILKFTEVYAYRSEELDRAAYLAGNSRFKNEQLPWGEYYELPGSSWKTDFPSDKIIVNESLKNAKLKHWVIFCSNQLIECLALDYRFTFDFAIAEKLEESYPKGYLNHYLALFAAHFRQLNKDNYTIYTNLYIQLEGKKEFEALKEEVKKIKANKDVDSYVKIANCSEIPNFGRKQLDEMLQVIESYDPKSKYA